GLRMIHVPGAGGDHVGSATINSNPHYAACNRVTHDQWNTHYYCMKWGGDWTKERFCHPYNNPEHDHQWWPGPGASIAARDWDRADRGHTEDGAQRTQAELENMYYTAWQNPSDLCEHVP